MNPSFRKASPKPRGFGMTSAMKQVLATAFLSACLASPAAADTVLSLSATGSDIVIPDQMVASLAVQCSGHTARDAAAATNTAMAKALAQARAVPGVTATTADYSETSLSDQNGHVTGYQASQSLDLTMAAPGGAPPPAFTELTGRLQEAGLLLNELDGNLSPAGADAAQRAAITDAIHRLNATAAAVAATLNDQVGAIKTLQLDLQSPGPVMPVRMMAMAVAAAPPPQAAPGPITVTATINAEISLTSKP